MAGCMPCFVIPLLLFLFHRYIQPIILKFWNPWEKIEDKDKKEVVFSCPCKGNDTCEKKAETKEIETKAKQS